MKKKLIVRLLKPQSCIVIALIGHREDRNQNLGLHFINELDFSQKRTIVIEHGDPLFNHESMCRDILGKYLDLVRLEVVHAYREMLSLQEQL
jgi:hypothetical protein